MDQEVVQKLKEWDLEDAAEALARARYKSIRRLRKMDGDDVDKLGLPLATARELKDLVQALKTEELLLPSAAGAQEEAAAKKTAEEEAKKRQRRRQLRRLRRRRRGKRRRRSRRRRRRPRRRQKRRQR